MRPSLIFAAILLPAAACSDAASPASSAAGKPSAYALAAEPAGAVPVVDARKAAPKDSAVVVGRVKEIAPGLASFTLVDASLEYCGQAGGKEAGKEMACDEPWDYCCHPADEIAKYLVAVTVKDAKGDPVAGRLPELRNLDLVVVKGRLVKGKPQAERDIGCHVLAHGLGEQIVELFFAVSEESWPRPLRKFFQPPVFLLANPPISPLEPGAGRQLFDAVYQRLRPGHIIHSQVAVQRVEIEVPVNFLVHQDRLQLRSKADVAAAKANVERLDADAVAGQHQPLL